MIENKLLTIRRDYRTGVSYNAPPPLKKTRNRVAHVVSSFREMLSKSLPSQVFAPGSAQASLARNIRTRNERWQRWRRRQRRRDDHNDNSTVHAAVSCRVPCVNVYSCAACASLLVGYSGLTAWLRLSQQKKRTSRAYTRINTGACVCMFVFLVREQIGAYTHSYSPAPRLPSPPPALFCGAAPLPTYTITCTS